MSANKIATRKVTFLTLDGKVIDDDEIEARAASAYLARAAKSVARSGSDRKYATVSYLIPA